MSSDGLKLEHVRGVLIRLEETIIFSLIERAQWRQNLKIYSPGAMGGALDGASLLDYMMRDAEVAHARVRRYTSPDEHPFSRDLPEPILPALAYDDNPLHPNTVNINARIKETYEEEIIPFVCRTGDDLQYGSSAAADVLLLQALSKRIHYGKFVAESKYRDATESFDALISAHDRSGLEEAITVPEVEARLFDRVQRKAGAYGGELAAAGEYTVAPEKVKTIYERWIIPLSKRVEVNYLLQRLS